MVPHRMFSFLNLFSSKVILCFFFNSNDILYNLPYFNAFSSTYTIQLRNRLICTSRNYLKNHTKVDTMRAEFIPLKLSKNGSLTNKGKLQVIFNDTRIQRTKQTFFNNAATPKDSHVS